MRTSASEPNPVEIPYAGSSDAARATTTAALRSIASRAAELRDTDRVLWRATVTGPTSDADTP